jgi:cyclase
VSIPVITSGGCGLARHFVEGFLQGGADAVSAGTFFCFKDQNPMQTRAHIRNAGIPIRLLT